MHKRGQITVFIILGIVILISVFILFYVKTVVEKSEIETEQQKLLDFQSKVNSVNSFVSSCLDKILLSSVDVVGLNESRVSGYVKSNLSKCINFTIFEKQGLNISTESIQADTVISNYSMSVNVGYPITIRKESQTSQLNKFNSKMSLISHINLHTDQDGFVTQSVSVPNGDAALTIPEGTRAMDQNNNPLTSISMRILGTTYPIIGFFKYDFKPDGAAFEPPIILTTDYKDSDLPEGFHEQELEVKYFDEEADEWISLPSNIDVVNNRLITEISHFSEFGPGITDEEMDHQNQVFIISDKNWKNVLQLVPLTIWTKENKINKQPLLIIHEEDNGFDADSIIHFLQQYNTEKVTLVGETPLGFDNLLISDTGAGLNQNQIQRIDPETIINYWSSYDTVVYVNEDYKSSLLASTYASLINAPFIIKGSVLDKPDNFDGKNVVLIDIDSCPNNATCEERYDLPKLQKKFIELTNTDKIIIVNPNDVNVQMPEKFQTELGGKISKPFNSLSLSAPLLAAGKHEIIFFQDEIEEGIFSDVDKKVISLGDGFSGLSENDLKNINTILISKTLEIRNNLLSKIDAFFPGKKPEYLTIIADPNNIPASVWYSGNIRDDNKEPYQFRFSADRFYANNCEFPHGKANNIFGREKFVKCQDEKLELKTGRIYGITLSDTSSYIMRSLFYDELFSNTYGDDEYTAVIWNDLNWEEDENAGPDLSATFPMLLNNAKNTGYTTECQTSNPLEGITCKFDEGRIKIDSLKEKQFITYFGHGSYSSAGVSSDKIPKLDLPFAITWACHTNSFYSGATIKAKTYKLPQATKTFGMNFLRKGGLGYWGYVIRGFGIKGAGEPAGSTNNAALYYITQSLSMGEVAMNIHHDYDYFKMDSEKYNGEGKQIGENKALFLGDPTLTLKSTKKYQKWGKVGFK
jgi:hypothetical protein